jgi:hypothetical protein
MDCEIQIRILKLQMRLEAGPLPTIHLCDLNTSHAYYSEPTLPDTPTLSSKNNFTHSHAPTTHTYFKSLGL